ncbi:DUF1330 domain-containing protein [Paucibacter sp. M5-1]|uniref:DUF1330 domain-containing protein n=1 Tax=Paucibacter sp. M5-1 TaxID=3015998 RepID=UPI0010F7B659|nr:DUF1330 domain-containing protein [Paucibacter sp. M5-1]MCZ7880873.1 DUF1330 domain-containing protein [Paucibacter sp. M5-1]
MPAFAIAHLRDVQFGPDIVHYLERIDATLAPFGGQFRVHGASAEAMEGQWIGDIVVVEFPDLARARAWYRSEDYQAIVPLRSRNSIGEVILVDGVDGGHRATDILAGVGA